MLVIAATGCAAETATTPRADLVLPASDEWLREGAVAATSWLDMGSGPAGLNARASFLEPNDASSALIEALTAHTGSAYETHALVGEPDRELMLVSETGVADDSVAGLQYVMLLELEGREWRISEMWTRALCRRGVAQDVCV